MKMSKVLLKKENLGRFILPIKYGTYLFTTLKGKKRRHSPSFRKFSADFGEKYRMPSVKLMDDAVEKLSSYN